MNSANSNSIRIMGYTIFQLGRVREHATKSDDWNSATTEVEPDVAQFWPHCRFQQNSTINVVSTFFTVSTCIDNALYYLRFGNDIVVHLLYVNRSQNRAGVWNPLRTPFLGVSTFWPKRECMQVAWMTSALGENLHLINHEIKCEINLKRLREMFNLACQVSFVFVLFFPEQI